MLPNAPIKARRGMCFNRSLVAFALLISGFVVLLATGLPSRANGPLDAENQNPYRVLAPLQSGDLAIFPVVQANAAKAQHWQYITLDEGLRSGQVIVAEAGQVMGLIRSRHPGLLVSPVTGDEVNRLVLVNNSSRPLLLLAGEIVTGGKQDRVIGKDRIVPPESDPIDLSVFCIEPGRWTGESPEFRAAGKAGESFMVQPEVRSRAMAAQNQQQVWDAVGSAIHGMAAAGGATAGPTPTLPTTSYAQAMENAAVENDVDRTAAPLLQSGEALRAELSKEHAVGVVVAVRGEIIWADIFSDTEMLEKYWTKLIRSYAAEALTGQESRSSSPTTDDAERFLAIANSGPVSSEGETDIYRYSTIRSGDVESFVLRALLPDTGFDVHISKIRTEPTAGRIWVR
jgi:hypothetical protein